MSVDGYKKKTKKKNNSTEITAVARPWLKMLVENQIETERSKEGQKEGGTVEE